MKMAPPSVSVRRVRLNRPFWRKVFRREMRSGRGRRRTLSTHVGVALDDVAQFDQGCPAVPLLVAFKIRRHGHCGLSLGEISEHKDSLVYGAAVR
jgi:hypothetical protein